MNSQPTSPKSLTPDEARNHLLQLVSRTIREEADDRHADWCINFKEWQWHQGVALHGLMKAHGVLNDEQSRAFVVNWVDWHLAKGILPKSINTTAPLLAIVELVRCGSNSRLREICEEYARWCVESAPRLEDGTFEHSCTENKYPLQVWADTLFMGCIFLARWGILSGNRQYVDEVVKQFGNHYAHLRDPGTGLIFHGYDGASRSQMGVLWGRGNGWFTAASIEVLESLPADTPGYGLLLENFQAHLHGVLATQDESGAWHTVMNEPSTSLEMSATAAFAMGLRWAAGQSWAPEDCQSASERAYAALVRRISPDGELLEASGGTCVMPTPASYDAVPFANTAFAQGLAMMSLSQFLRKPAKADPAA